jgi:hypothetical protein
MNERIKTLAKAAGYDTITESYMKALGFNPEKFAELIVRECQDCVEHYIRDCGEIGSLPDTVIMKHFGVEE